MTDETAIIWRTIKEKKEATLPEIVSWTGRHYGDAIVTINLMIRVCQLKFLRRQPEDGRAVYGPGLLSTFGWYEL